jgi:hypothetical protein
MFPYHSPKSVIFFNKVNAMRHVEEHRMTGNNPLHRKLSKAVLANKGEISCPYCLYNKRENQKHQIERSWKKYRLTQFKDD